MLRDLLNSISNARTRRASLLNRKKGGTLFVNELVLHIYHHRTAGVVLIGIQTDVSHQISVTEFLQACASCQSYATLLGKGEETLTNSTDLVCLDTVANMLDSTFAI